MTTPYSENPRGDLPLPKIHIPTWFNIELSEINDGKLDLDILTNINFPSNPESSSNGDYLINLGGSHISGACTMDPYESECLYTLTIPAGNLLFRSTYTWDNTGVTYYISFDWNSIRNISKGPEKTFTFGWSDVTRDKINSLKAIVLSYWLPVYYDLIDENYLTISEVYNIIDYYLSEFSLSDFLQYGVNANMSFSSPEPELDPIPVTSTGDNQRDEIIIGTKVPNLGTIIAYSNGSGVVLEGTNSAHILNFKNSMLRSFNFRVPHNHVINRIEKLYRAEYGTTNQILSTMELIVNTPNYCILEIDPTNESDASVTNELLVLVEGGH